MDNVRNGRATHEQVGGDRRHDDSGVIASDHQSDHRSDDHAIPERYKLVLFNNEVLRLDSVSGTVWILDFERDPQSRQVVRPRWVTVEVASVSPPELTDLTDLTDTR